MKRIYCLFVILLFLCSVLLSAQDVSVQYKCAESNEAVNQIKPHINIVNNGTQPLDLSEVTLRYYYSAENKTSQQFHCDYARIGSANVQGTFVETDGNEFYLEVSFSGGVVQAGSSSGEMQLRFNKSNWTNYDQADDYSFNPLLNSFTEWDKVTLYKEGILLFGVPKGAGGVEVSITSPAANRVFFQSEEITLSADAKTSDGIITKVEFFDNNIKLGEDSEAPYVLTVSQLEVKEYTFAAKATDSQGRSAVCEPVTVSVVPDEQYPPEVSIITPANGFLYNLGDLVEIEAQASDIDGEITVVEFFADGIKIAESSSAPYTAVLTAELQSYELTAAATDDDGLTALSEAVSIFYDHGHPPVCSISSPLSGSSFNEGDNIVIAADASHPDGAIVKVEFFNKTVKIGEALESPFTFTIGSAEPGDYVLTARAAADNGLTTISGPVEVSVIPDVKIAPVVEILTPAAGDIFEKGDDITITASASDEDGEVVKVIFTNGLDTLAEVTEAPYTYTIKGAAPGSYTLQATAVDDDGKTGISQAVKVIVKDDVPPADLVLFYRCNNSENPTNQIKPVIKIKNNGTESVSLDELTVRYFYTLEDGASGEQFHCDYAQIDSASLNGTFDSVTADIRALEVSFKSGLAPLAPGQDTGDIQLRFNKNNWSNYDQENDISYNPEAASYVEAKQMALYQNGVLIFGEEPDGNKAPAVFITSPADGAGFEENVEVEITADAEDLDGSIALVEFLVNGSKIGQSSLSPYKAAFTPSAAGDYILTARATDDLGKSKVSSEVVIKVAGNLPPEVNITSPANGAAYTPGESVEVTAEASDENGVKRVDFYLDGELAGSDLSAPYSIELAGPVKGNHVIYAEAFDLEDLKGVSAEVSFSVIEKQVAPPKVTITAPARHSYFNEGEPILITADASDSNGSIKKVEFYEGDNLLATDTAAPYEFEWTDAAVNMYGVYAVAYDDDGQTGTARSVTVTVAGETPGKFNYGEALQKSIWFYEVQQSGPLPEWNRVNWRADSTERDGSDNNIDLSGGWFDAGDHIKFGMPMAASAHNLAWGVYEYKDAYIAAGQYDHIMNNLRFVMDYFIKCHTAPNEFYFQVGDKPTDHKWWGPAEMLNQDVRISYKATLESPASCVVGDTATVLALGYLLFKDEDPAYAAECLEHAKQLFNFAWITKSDEGYTAPGLDVTYKSWSGYWDELMWSAAWLYLATGEQDYLDKAESCVDHIQREDQSEELKYTWAHCWDVKHYGAMLLLARITDKPIYKDFMKMHLDWWAIDGARSWIEDKFAWLDQWGSTRYAANTSLLAFIYSDWVDDPVLSDRYRSFAENQINFILGENSKDFSFMIGFGKDHPQNPHHRTTNGSWWDSWKVPGYTRHVLYGAMVGGPESADIEDYNDMVDDYESNEVACDYNSGLVGCLAKMYSLYGGDPVANFPIAESADMDEFYVEAGVNNSSANYTGLKLQVNNKSAFPARKYQDLGFKYFMDLQEVFDAGYDVSDITVEANYIEFEVNISELTLHKGTVYFVKVDFVDGNEVHPGGQSPFAGEVQLRIAMPDGTTIWDPTNDYSYQGVGGTSMELLKTERIPVYNGETLIFGVEP